MVNVTSIACPTTDELGLCGILTSLGAGFAILLTYLAAALPIFLILLVVVGGIGALLYAIVYVIKKAIVSGHRMK